MAEHFHVKIAETLPINLMANKKTIFIHPKH